MVNSYTKPVSEQVQASREITAPSRKAQPFFTRARLISTFAAFIILMALNSSVQMDRPYWDAQSDMYGALGRMHDCETLGPRIDVLFTGSSRVEHGVNASTVDSTMEQLTGRKLVSCNMGMLGTTFEEDYYALERLYRRGAAPKLIVENLWEFNLNTHARLAPQAGDISLARMRSLADISDAGDMSRHFGDGWAQATGQFDFAASKLFALYGDRGGLFAWACGTRKMSPCDAVQNTHGNECFVVTDGLGTCLSARPPMSSVPVSERQAPAPDRYAFLGDYAHDFTIGGDEIDYLSKFVRLAQAHHARVAFVISPLHPLFYTYFPKPSDWPIIVTYWQTYSRTQGIPLYDASHLPGYTDDDFADPHHLTIAGAIKFSKWTASAIVEPMLQ